jgi:hypothetical protein
MTEISLGICAGDWDLCRQLKEKNIVTNFIMNSKHLSTKSINQICLLSWEILIPWWEVEKLINFQELMESRPATEMVKD